MAKELSEEEVFANDIDPLDAIRDIRKEEGVAEEDLIPAAENDELQKVPAVIDGEDELDELAKVDDKKEDIDGEEENLNIDDEDKDKENLDVDDDNLDEDKDKEKEEEEEEPQVVKKKFVANGQEFEFTEQEMLEQFEIVFGQAMDYTKKTQKMAPFRKMISALEEEGITSEQLNTAIDALKGNKQAIQTLLKENEIDPFSLSTDQENGEEYSPTDYGKNDTQLGIQDVISKISGDREYEITANVIDEQWDAASRNALASNPSMIEGLHSDIKSGVYDKVAPVAMKMKVLDGNTKSDIEYYMLAGEEVLGSEQDSGKPEQSVDELNKAAQDADDNFDQASSEAQRKRSATPTRKRADRKTVVDYLDDDDEAFESWYKKLQASQ